MNKLLLLFSFFLWAEFNRIHFAQLSSTLKKLGLNELLSSPSQAQLFYNDSKLALIYADMPQDKKISYVNKDVILYEKGTTIALRGFSLSEVADIQHSLPDLVYTNFFPTAYATCPQRPHSLIPSLLDPFSRFFKLEIWQKTKNCLSDGLEHFLLSHRNDVKTKSAIEFWSKMFFRAYYAKTQISDLLDELIKMADELKNAPELIPPLICSTITEATLESAQNGTLLLPLLKLKLSRLRDLKLSPRGMKCAL